MKALENDEVQVLCPESVVSPLSASLTEIHLNRQIYAISPQFLLKAIVRGKMLSESPKFIVTSSPESRMPIRVLISILFLSMVGCEVIGIRNPKMWRRRNRVSPFNGWEGLFPLRKAKVSLLGNLSYFSEVLLLNRTKKMIFESKSMQSSFFEIDIKIGPKPNLVFSGRIPQRHFRDETHGPEKQNRLNKGIGIGVLGTLNPARRDYTNLLSACKLIESLGETPRIYFLGSYIGPESKPVVELFNKFIAYTPTAKIHYVSEHQINSFIHEIDVFVAPLSNTWDYLNGMSTGSISDAIFYDKPILIPSFLKETYRESDVNFFSNSETLAEKIQNYKQLMLPAGSSVTHQTLRYFLLQ